MERICPICGKTFRIYPCASGIRKTCSQKCRGQYLRCTNTPCAKCGKNPRVEGLSYCRLCSRELHLNTYYKHKTCPDAKRLTEEERHQYKVAKDARYRRKHYDIRVHNNRKRRARKRGVENTLTAREWEIIKAVYGYRCAYCGQKPKLLTQDHIIPISKGGGHTANNVIPACRSCNSRKSVGEPSPFQPILSWYFED